MAEAEAENAKTRIDKNPPRAYDLEDRREHQRLIHEVYGYLRTCRTAKCGGDFAGRDYAMVALRRLMARDIEITDAAENKPRKCTCGFFPPPG